MNLGGIFDHRRWALPSEVLRLPATAAVVAARLPGEPWRLPLLAGLSLAVAASWLCLLAYRRQFHGEPQPPCHLIGRSASPEDADATTAMAATGELSLTQEIRI
jgi:hypothetical protein